jgi:hypothetical protein
VNAEFQALAGRILDETGELVRLADRVQRAWEQAERTGDDLYLDSVALNLHGFYGATERMFELIVVATGERTPQSGRWHQQLLELMMIEVPGTRPAVISSETKELLSDFRGFRHVARNVYAFDLDRGKLAALVKCLPSAAASVVAELRAFAAFLEGDGS